MMRYPLSRVVTGAAIAVLMIAAAAGSARAQDPTVPSAAAAAGPQPAPPDPKICKRVAATGSRVGGERVCKTAEEWASDEAAARDVARRMSTTRGATKGQ